MLRLLSLLVIAVMLSAMPSQAIAGDEDDVKAAVNAMFAALANRDADGWIDAHTADATWFGGGPLGGMLVEAAFDREAQRAAYAEADAAGTPLAPPLQVNHMDVQVMCSLYDQLFVNLTSPE